MGKSKILQVVPELDAGGVERTTIEMAEAITDAGGEAHVASVGGRLEDELKAAGGILHRINAASKNPLTIAANIGHLKQISKKYGIQLIHARSRAPAWSAYQAAKDLGVPFVTTYHGVYNARSGLKRRYNRIMAMGDIVIANSRHVAEHLIAAHGTDPRRVVVIYRGVDMLSFDPKKVSAKAAAAHRENWGVSDNDKVILLPGRLTRWKGQLVAIEALTDLPADTHLVLLGDAQGRDKYVSELNAKITALGLTSRVHLAEHTRDMPGALMAADVVLSASIEPEAFGRIAVEAQAMGRPVVASAHGGALETVTDRETGWHCTPGDAQDTARAIDLALDTASDPVKSKLYAAAALANVNDKFTTAKLQSLTMSVYDQLLAARQ